MLRIVLSIFLLCGGLSSAGYAGQPPFWGDYPSLPAYIGSLQEPALSSTVCVESNEKWCPWNFRTRLREGAGSTGVNFNGAFTIVTWGCGTECQSGGVIDRSDGRVYELPIAELGYEFYSDSSLLVVNPDPEDMYDAGEMPEWLSRRFYHFRNGTFVLVHEDTGDAGSVASILDTPHPVNQEVLEGIE